MRRLPTLSAFALAGVLALGATSCGKSDDASPTPTKAEYVKDANKVCTAQSKELASKSKDLPGADKDKIVTFIRDTFVPSVRDQLAEIRKLGYPDGDKDTLEAIYVATEKKLDEIVKDPEKFATADDPFTEINKKLDAYGLVKCGSEG